MRIAATSDQRTELHRAVVMSLFTWRRAGTDDPVDDAERQGWWGDATPMVAGDRIGSRLWLLRRRTITEQTLRDARTYAREALQWLIDDGAATAVDVTVERGGVQAAFARVVIHTVEGLEHRFSFDDFWQVIHAV